MRIRFTYANVASTAALAIALAGGGVAVAAGLGADTVGSVQIKDGGVRNQDLAGDSIGTLKVRSESLNGSDVLDGSLSGADVDGSLTGANVADGSLGAADIDGSLTGANISDGSLGGFDIDGTITGANVTDGSLSGDDVDGSLTGANVTDGSLSGADVDGSLTGANVSDDSLTGDDIDESTLDLQGLIPAPPGSLTFTAIPSGTMTTPSTPTDVSTVTFDAPSAGVVYLSAQAEFNATASTGYVEAVLKKDSVIALYSDWDAGDADGFFDLRQSSFVVVPVTAGPHTFALNLNGVAPSSSQYYGAVVAGIFVPDATAPRPHVQKSPNRR